MINETAVRYFSLGTAEGAVGRRLFGTTGPEVIGVVPDFSMASLQRRIEPTLYFLGGSALRPFDALYVKVSTTGIPSTLAAVDRTWRRQPEATGPVNRIFLDQFIEALYLDLEQVP